MPTSMTPQDIHDAVVSYLAGELTLDELDDLLLERTLDAQPGTAVHDASRQVMLLLAEYTSGHRDEGDLKDQLRTLQPTVNAPTRG